MSLLNCIHYLICNQGGNLHPSQKNISPLPKPLYPTFLKVLTLTISKCSQNLKFLRFTSPSNTYTSPKEFLKMSLIVSKKIVFKEAVENPFGLRNLSPLHEQSLLNLLLNFLLRQYAPHNIYKFRTCPTWTSIFNTQFSS